MALASTNTFKLLITDYFNIKVDIPYTCALACAYMPWQSVKTPFCVHFYYATGRSYFGAEDM